MSVLGVRKFRQFRQQEVYLNCIGILRKLYRNRSISRIIMEIHLRCLKIQWGNILREKALFNGMPHLSIPLPPCITTTTHHHYPAHSKAMRWGCRRRSSAASRGGAAAGPPRPRKRSKICPVRLAANFWQNFDKKFARFRLYWRRSLQVNARFAAFCKIYQII